MPMATESWSEDPMLKIFLGSHHEALSEFQLTMFRSSIIFTTSPLLHFQKVDEPTNHFIIIENHWITNNNCCNNNYSIIIVNTRREAQQL